MNEKMKDIFEHLAKEVRSACAEMQRLTGLEYIGIRYDGECKDLTIDLDTFIQGRDRVQAAMEACEELGLEPEVDKRKSVMSFGNRKNMELSVQARANLSHNTLLKIWVNQDTGEACEIVGYEEKIVYQPIWKCPDDV
jgi:hypothetical protein